MRDHRRYGYQLSRCTWTLDVTRGQRRVWYGQYASRTDNMQNLTAALALVGLLGVASAAAAARISPDAAASLAAGAGTPYIVEIRESYIVGDNHKGSGVLVSPQWVLTTQDITPGWFASLYVKVGDPKHAIKIDIDEKQTQKETKDNALALLKLKKPVELSSSVRPANLPFQDAYFYSNQVSAIPASWGGSGGKALKANEATLVFAEDDCLELLGLKDNSTSLLCTTGLQNNVWTCDGDEGAPLVQDQKNGVSKLVGIAINTKKVNCKKAPKGNAYVNVARHSQWVLNAIYADAKK
ncbi:hypothetical protein ONE63_004300 [Megalurothrips usitatus]|uniref:Peptidase S1 domain-containing protein n=1 Tax=Megalurothrips usitatus TaxID=439358 RepID=A0AAV7X2E3_9NEOP|nr:hypothetical protein ONE63_004300 [Megalurothrips usitatus]